MQVIGNEYLVAGLDNFEDDMLFPAHHPDNTSIFGRYVLHFAGILDIFINLCSKNFQTCKIVSTTPRIT
jgi:hypothetical protein